MRIIRKRFMDEEETDHSYNWQDVLWRSVNLWNRQNKPNGNEIISCC